MAGQTAGQGDHLDGHLGGDGELPRPRPTANMFGKTIASRLQLLHGQSVSGPDRCRRIRETSGPDRPSSRPSPPGQGPSVRPVPPGGRSVGGGCFPGASLALFGRKREGGATPEVDVGRLLLGGLLVLGLAAGTACTARLAVELPIRPAGLLPRSLAFGAPLLSSFRCAARRVLARSAARVVRGLRFRGCGPSRQRRVSRDRRPARGPRRGRTRSPGLIGPHAVPNRRNLPRFAQTLCGVPRSRGLCRQ